MPLPYWEPEYDDAQRLLVARCLGSVVALYLVTGAAASDVGDAVCRGLWVSPRLSPANRATMSTDPFGVTDAGTGAPCTKHAEHDLGGVNLRDELAKALSAPNRRQRAIRTVRLRSASGQAA